MSSRTPWKLLAVALLLTGCQSGRPGGNWFASSEPVYSQEELASINSPRPAAARPQLAASMTASTAAQKSGTTTGSNGGVIQQVSATATVPPVAAGRVDELVRAGQAAIRQAGQGDSSQLQQARDLFQQALNLDNTNASAHHGIAIVADLQQDWATAERHYKQALRSRPQDASLLNDIGYSYLLQCRYHEASQYLNQTLQVSPQHERAHINLALLALKRGDRATAQQRLSSIYSASDAQTTLAKLEADIQNSGQETRVAMASNAVGNPVDQNFAPPMASQQFPQQPPQQFAQSQPQPQYSAGPVEPQPYRSDATAHSNRPIHVYPPGFEPQDAAESAAEVSYQNNGPPVQQQTAGMVLPGMNAAAPAANQPNGSTPGQSSQYGIPNPSRSGFAAHPNMLNGPLTGQTTSPAINGPQSVQPQQAYTPPVQPMSQHQQSSGHYVQQPQQQYQQQHQQPYQPPFGQPQNATSQANSYAAGTPTHVYPAHVQLNPATPGGSNGASDQNNVPLVGLNAGPGALFPIGNPTPPSANGVAPPPQFHSAPPSSYQPPHAGTGNAFPAHTVSASSMPYTPATASTPAPNTRQEFIPFPYDATGQQQQTQQQPQYSQPPLQQQQPQYQSYQPGPTNYGPAQPTGSVSSPAASQTSNAARRSPLAAYEQQLQNLDDQYNRTLQQMDGSQTGMTPAAGRY
ncbi:MAG: hypothetical protein R3C59_23500 [Planctomycetaceae bacterium]